MSAIYHHPRPLPPIRRTSPPMPASNFQIIKKSAITKVMVICLAAFLLGLLSGCGSSPNQISIIPNEPTPTLRLQPPEPLVLEKNYEWKVFKDNNTIILGLTEEDYKSHQRNMESIQGRLALLMEYLNQYRLFYEKEDDNNVN